MLNAREFLDLNFFRDQFVSETKNEKYLHYYKKGLLHWLFDTFHDDY